MSLYSKTARTQQEQDEHVGALALRVSADLTSLPLTPHHGGDSWQCAAQSPACELKSTSGAAYEVRLPQPTPAASTSLLSARPPARPPARRLARPARPSPTRRRQSASCQRAAVHACPARLCGW